MPDILLGAVGASSSSSSSSSSSPSPSPSRTPGSTTLLEPLYFKGIGNNLSPERFVGDQGRTIEKQFQKIKKQIESLGSNEKIDLDFSGYSRGAFFNYVVIMRLLKELPLGLLNKINNINIKAYDPVPGLSKFGWNYNTELKELANWSYKMNQPAGAATMTTNLQLLNTLLDLGMVKKSDEHIVGEGEETSVVGGHYFSSISEDIDPGVRSELERFLTMIESYPNPSSQNTFWQNGVERYKNLISHIEAKQEKAKQEKAKEIFKKVTTKEYLCSSKRGSFSLFGVKGFAPTPGFRSVLSPFAADKVQTKIMSDSFMHDGFFLYKNRCCIQNGNKAKCPVDYSASIKTLNNDIACSVVCDKSNLGERCYYDPCKGLNAAGELHKKSSSAALMVPASAGSGLDLSPSSDSGSGSEITGRDGSSPAGSVKSEFSDAGPDIKRLSIYADGSVCDKDKDGCSIVYLQYTAALKHYEHQSSHISGNNAVASCSLFKTLLHHDAPAQGQGVVTARQRANTI